MSYRMNQGENVSGKMGLRGKCVSAAGKRLCAGRLLPALLVFTAMFCLCAARVFPARADGGLELHTGYPGMAVEPGDSLSLTVDVDNLTGAALEADVSVTSMPDGWDGYLQGGSYEISRIYVPAGEGSATMNLHLTVPGELEEGSYTVRIHAKAVDSEAADDLEFRFSAASQEAGRGTFTSEYPMQEGASGTTFSFSTTLINNSLKPQTYNLSSNAPTGWTVSFLPSDGSTAVAAIDVEAGASQAVTVSVEPPESVESGEYQIPISAVSSSETLSTDLSVTITGTYGIELSTPDGRLSFDANAGRESDVTLYITNTGNVDLENVSLNSSAPSGWTVTYNLDDNIIESLPAGSTSEVVASVKPGNDAITGDYVTSFSVSSEESSDTLEFRVSVKTSTMWGVVAIALVVVVALGVTFVFNKFGRR